MTKYKAILEVERGFKTMTGIAKDLDAPSTLSQPGSRRLVTTRMLMRPKDFVPKRMKKDVSKDVNDALHAWMRAAHSCGIPISGPILQANAASRMGTS